MRLDRITVELRPRTPWEAVDLGMAMVRAHARAVWIAWLGATLPFLLVFNAIAYAIDQIWLAMLAMWWLKPLFDRAPLYVLSRAVFGATPGARETLRAQWRGHWHGMGAWLTWRRLHPARSMLLPVDQLERLGGEARGARAKVLAGSQSGQGALLTIVGAHLEMALYTSLIALGLLFVPIDFLGEAAKAVFETLFDTPPAWAELLANLLAWIAMSLLEPFYVGAGFGLYLNRRTVLEAWDVELAFRRLASRLAQVATIVLVAVALTGLAAPLRAETAPPVAMDATDGVELGEVFGYAARHGPSFERAVAKAYEDPQLGAQETVSEWRARRPAEKRDAREDTPGWARALGAVFAFFAEAGLWIALVVLLLVLWATRSRWWPYLEPIATRRRRADPIREQAIAAAPQGPADPVAEARARWARGDARGALGLLYAHGVERLGAALGRPLPPGVTESDCLRHARALGDAPLRDRLTRTIGHWRALAWAHRAPRAPEVDALLEEWAGAEVGP